MLKLSNRGREKWQTHLRTAFNFVPALLQARMPLTMQDMISPEYRSPQLLTLPSEEADCAIEFLLDSYRSTSCLPLLLDQRLPSTLFNYRVSKI